MGYLKVTPEIMAQMVEDKKNGMSIYKIADKHNIHRISVYRLFKKHGYMKKGLFGGIKWTI